MWFRRDFFKFKTSVIALQLLLIFGTREYFVEAELFKGCDEVYNVNPGYSYLESPYFPDSYPSGTSCRYKFIARPNNYIQMTCSVNIDKGPIACSTEYFHVARDGDTSLRNYEKFCGKSEFMRNSLSHEITVAYVSYDGSGHFNCTMYVRPKPCECGWSVNTKIVNGKEAKINEYPSMVGFKDTTSNLNIYCAGAIISHRFVLTTAHCARFQINPNYIAMLVGDHDISIGNDTPYAAIYFVSQIIVHPLYSPDPVENDIALFVSTKDIEWSRGVGPICLPPSSKVSETFAYQNVDAIGWGTLSFGGPTSDVLQKITLMVIENSVCQQIYQGVSTITSDDICTYDSTGKSRDSCQYDSGGPIVLRRSRQFLLGCISYGKICGQSGYATGVNVRVTNFLQWIHEQTAYTTCEKPL